MMVLLPMHCTELWYFLGTISTTNIPPTLSSRSKAGFWPSSSSLLFMARTVCWQGQQIDTYTLQARSFGLALTTRRACCGRIFLEKGKESKTAIKKKTSPRNNNHHPQQKNVDGIWQSKIESKHTPVGPILTLSQFHGTRGMMKLFIEHKS